MAAREREPRLAMVHRLAVRLPSNERKVRAIVVGVALDAILARSAFPHPHRVHTAILRHAIPDLSVAIEAFEFHSAGAQIVTLGATQHSREGLMGFRQRAGRDLCVSGSGAQRKRRKT